MNKNPLLLGFLNKIRKIVLTIEKATSTTYYKKVTYPGSLDDDAFGCCWGIRILRKKELYHTRTKWETVEGMATQTKFGQNKNLPSKK